MNAVQILAELESRDVRIWTEGDRLKFDAPAGALTDEDIARLKAHKLELLNSLRPLTPSPTREAMEARQLLLDLQAAGCGFHIVDDELRMSGISRISTAPISSRRKPGKKMSLLRNADEAEKEKRNSGAVNAIARDQICSAVYLRF